MSPIAVDQSPRSHSGPRKTGVSQMKEYSLIRHIESLKCAANAPVFFPSINNAALPSSPGASLLPISLSNEQSDLARLRSRPQSSTWAVDPALVPGNLRNHGDPKSTTLTLEEILSRGSSVSDKNTDDPDDSQFAIKSSVKARRKLSRSSKKNAARQKGSGGSHSPKMDNSKGSVVFNSFSKPPKGNRSNVHATSVSTLDSLTALCKGAKIHEKARNSTTATKPTPSSQKSSESSVHSVLSLTSSSAAKVSLNNAINEYSKKLAGSTTQTRRKSSKDEEETKLTKVFLSDKQSGVVSDCGMSVPCAPPATPTPEQLRKYEYVPSLQDVRAQRSIRQRLQLLESRVQIKEKKKQEESMKAERQTLRDKNIELRKRQRMEIYALNKVMTDLENQRFVQFMQTAGANI